MKPSKTSEVLAVVFAMAGVLLLGFVCYPLLNPIQYRLDPGPTVIPWQRYVFGTLISALLLAIAWHFNIQGLRTTRAADDQDR